MPPPRSASNSRIPVRRRAICASSIDASATGPAACSGWGALRAAALLTGLSTGVSSNVFHASHDGHRPSQRADSKPHAVQK